MAQWINNNGEFWDGGSIVIDDRKYLNPSDELLIQAGYHQYTPPEPTESQLLAITKSNKLQEIEDYDEGDDVNQFYLAGSPMWLDAQTRQILRISIESYQAMGSEQVTKWFGGQQFTFPTSAWVMMLNALEVYAAEALNVTESHKAEVLAMDDIDAIEAYDITQGYPEKLNLTTEWLRSQS